ncbi:MAG TPA: cell division protein ZapA [Synergistetes bacterium]|nr:cell division protein ZapA [Synergistota bacterium]
MADEPRRVYVTLGKKSYSILTLLDEKRFERVARIVKDSLSRVDISIDQEERLLLACFKLAYSIEKAENRLGELSGESDGS